MSGAARGGLAIFNLNSNSLHPATSAVAVGLQSSCRAASQMHVRREAARQWSLGLQEGGVMHSGRQNCLRIRTRTADSVHAIPAEQFSGFVPVPAGIGGFKGCALCSNNVYSNEWFCFSTSLTRCLLSSSLPALIDADSLSLPTITVES